MSPHSNLVEPRAPLRGEPSSHATRYWHADLLARLSQWFSVEFHLVDGETGELLHCGFDQSALQCEARGAMCRAVAEQGQATLVEEIEPLVVLAIPVQDDRHQCVVALGTFVTAGDVPDENLARVSALLELEPDDAKAWVSRQTEWVTSVLIRMGQLATERLAAEWRLKALEREARDLSLNLSHTYEEISLIYRLTQNLKLSSGDENLAEMALDWLSDVLPAESLAIQLIATDRSSTLGRLPRNEPFWVSRGECSLNSEMLSEIIAHCGLQAGKRPLVINPPITTMENWPWPAIQQLVIVSLCEGSHCFGWLVAVNHSSGGEFGTVEASLLSSVAAILGIHTGNNELYQQQRDLFAGVVRALTSAIDAKDPYTCGHSDRVARVSVRLAEELGCSRDQIDTIYLGGLLHDVGKIGIDDNVLRKPGKLTESEYEHIKTHAQIGFKILSDIKQLDEVLPVVLHHHEQWNGRGYPHGLAGDDIPFLARIVAVADSFDAMGSDRPYRPGMPDDKLDAIMRDGANKQWDADVVEAFFRARDDIRAIAHQKPKPLAVEQHDWV